MQLKHVMFLGATLVAAMIAAPACQPVQKPPPHAAGAAVVTVDVITVAATLPIETTTQATPLASSTRPQSPTSTQRPTSTPSPRPPATEGINLLTSPTASPPLPSPTNTPVPATATPAAATTTPVEEAGASPGNIGPHPINIGTSFNGRAIIDYPLGQGPNDVVLVGGIHGGYEWNTTLLTYGLLDYFLEHPERIPDSVTLHIIPAANPDGLFAVTGKEGRFESNHIDHDTVPGRFNGRGVDLNRNWDCQWMPTSTWRGNDVSAGQYPFSEPETRALREYLLNLQPAVVLFYHSAANAVFAAGCPAIHQPSMALATTYGVASGYPVYERFFHYDVNGDASDWLSTQNIPSFSVELVSHQALDWDMNLAGVQALMARIAGPERSRFRLNNNQVLPPIKTNGAGKNPAPSYSSVP